ncbi:MAG: SRPBCC family protein [Chloroflexota bacterium]
MTHPTESIDIQASADQVWQTLSDLPRLPEWYVPSQWIRVLTDGPVRPSWQFTLGVKTLPGFVLDALGTVTTCDAQSRTIIWRGKAMGIEGDSRWQVTETTSGRAKLEHTFAGQGWLFFLSVNTGRNQLIMQQRLQNLKALVESENNA